MSAFDLKNKNLLISIAGAVILLVVLEIILTDGASNITRANVEQKLQQVTAQISEEAARNNKEGKLTYDAITIEGWGFNKHATVNNVRLDLTDKAPPGAVPQETWSLSTAKMEVVPNEVMPHGLLFILPQPLLVTENGQPQETVAFSDAPKFGYFNGNLHKTHAIVQSLHLPPQITITPAAPEADGKVKRLIISFDKNPTLYEKIMPEAHQREAAYQLRNIKVATDAGTEATIASLYSHLAEAPGPNGRTQGKYTLEVADLALHDGDKATKAYSLDADIDYAGDTAQPGSAAAGNIDMTINKASLLSDDFKVNASGAFSMSGDDPLPFGNVTLNISGADKFLTSELLPESMRAPLSDALHKAAGQPATVTLTDVSIPVRREKRGVLYVGNVTFETLAASMLTGLLTPSAAAPAALPPAPVLQPQPPAPEQKTPPAAAPETKPDAPKAAPATSAM